VRNRDTLVRPKHARVFAIPLDSFKINSNRERLKGKRETTRVAGARFTNLDISFTSSASVENASPDVFCRMTDKCSQASKTSSSGKFSFLFVRAILFFFRLSLS